MHGYVCVGVCVVGGGGASFDNVISLYIRNILLYKRKKKEKNILFSEGRTTIFRFTKYIAISSRLV